ncbi:unnamed protein product [Orchesella dallaii]|uniref:Small ribosomal subunit protein uS10m n=1 Tax=Orchesella dallaii TaxID=48710 RepID=A0ABP1QSX7_9HEXA
MEILKLTSRSKLAWQCLCQATAKSFHSTTTAASGTIMNQKTVKGCHPFFMTTPHSNSSFRVIPFSSANKLNFYYSTETSVNQKAENFASEGVPETGESNSQTVSNSSSQTGELLPSEQETADWDNKLDKLYKSVELEVLAYEPSVLDSYQWFVITAARNLGIKVGKSWSPFKSNKLRFALLKSAFVHKKHVVHYEVRTHHRFIIFHHLTSSTADTFLEYIERNLPEGVGLKVTRVEAKALPDYLQKKPQQ